MTQAQLLAEQLKGTREWTLKLVEDLSGDDWTYQPAEGLPHALWLCGHLASAQNTLVHVRCFGGGVLDAAFAGHFPIGEPVKSAAEHDYPSLDVVLEKMRDVHASTCKSIAGMSDALLAEPAFGAGGKPHPHYTDKCGAIAHCNRHEAFHAGQLATLRRLLGKPFLR